MLTGGRTSPTLPTVSDAAERLQSIVLLLLMMMDGWMEMVDKKWMDAVVRIRISLSLLLFLLFVVSSSQQLVDN